MRMQIFFAETVIRSNLLIIKSFWFKLGGLGRLCVKHIHINFHTIWFNGVQDPADNSCPRIEVVTCLHISDHSFMQMR